MRRTLILLPFALMSCGPVPSAPKHDLDKRHFFIVECISRIPVEDTSDDTVFKCIRLADALSVTYKPRGTQ